MATAPTTTNTNNKKRQPEKEKTPTNTTPTTNPEPTGLEKQDEFEFELLPIPKEYEGSDYITIQPKKLFVSKIDARDTPLPPDKEMVESVKLRGLIQDPLVTYARHKVTKQEGWLIAAGRRRRQASIEAELKEITVKVKQIDSYQDYLIIAGMENIQRQNMSAWDIYRYIVRLTDSGMKSKDVASKLQVTDGYVSQHLSIRKLDPRVQKFIKDAAQEPFKSAAITVARDLKRITDPEKQFLLAEKAVKEKLTASDVHRHVDAMEAEQNGKGDQKEKGAGGKKKYDIPDKIDEKYIRFLEPKDAVSYINGLQLQYAKAKENTKTTKERLSYLKGKIEAAGVLSGISNPDKEEATETTSETSEED